MMRQNALTAITLLGCMMLAVAPATAQEEEYDLSSLVSEADLRDSELVAGPIFVSDDDTDTAEPIQGLATTQVLATEPAGPIATPQLRNRAHVPLLDPSPLANHQFTVTQPQYDVVEAPAEIQVQPSAPSSVQTHTQTKRRLSWQGRTN